LSDEIWKPQQQPLVSGSLVFLRTNRKTKKGFAPESSLKAALKCLMAKEKTKCLGKEHFFVVVNVVSYIHLIIWENVIPMSMFVNK
jgi:hypothetical protein